MKRTALGALVLLITTVSLAAEPERYFVATRRPIREIGVNSVARELRDPGERRVKTFDIVHGFAASLTAAEAASLRNSPDVRYVEPVVSRHLLATVAKPGRETTPYGISLVHATEAWAGRLAGNVNVVVIDSGVNGAHAEIRDVFQGGYNVLEPEEPVRDGVGHGTHVAGTIAAAHNDLGVVGVAPNGIRLWGVRAIGDDGFGSMEDVMAGLEWALEKKKTEGGRWVVNFSLGGEESSNAEREAIARAIADGMVIVAAAGNESIPTDPAPVSYPAAYPNVISVGAVDENVAHAWFSNEGPELEFVAPGVKVISLDLHDDTFLSYVRTHDNQVIETKPLVGSKPEGGITAEVIDCGLGTPADFGPAVQGKIAVIQRGGDTFADKVRRAKEAGAVAAVIYNNSATTAIVWTLYPQEDPDAKNYPWPVAVGMTLDDGEALLAKGGSITIGLDPDDYSQRTGTSMSAPHVTGAVALLWMLAPAATPEQIYNALITTARDIGPEGKDDKTGYGLIDVYAAAKMLAPSAFGTPRPRFLRRR